MQQVFNSTPSRKIHIPLCDTFLNINAEEEFLLRKKLEEQPIDVLVKKHILTLVFFMVALSSIALKKIILRTFLVNNVRLLTF